MTVQTPDEHVIYDAPPGAILVKRRNLWVAFACLLVALLAVVALAIVAVEQRATQRHQGHLLGDVRAVQCGSRVVIPAGRKSVLDSQTAQRLVRLCGPQQHGGATGKTGAGGLRGPQGKTGARGPRGRRGRSGHPGGTGAQGPRGAQGAPGPQGPRGQRGPRGPAGPVPDTSPVINQLSKQIEALRALVCRAVPTACP